MNKTVVTGVFIFSLALNLAVAGTLGWDWWMERRSPPSAAPSVQMPLSRQEWSRARKAWHADQREAMEELRQKISIKRAEMFDLLAAHPRDSAAAEKSLNELIALRGEMERERLFSNKGLPRSFFPKLR